MVPLGIRLDLRQVQPYTAGGDPAPLVITVRLSLLKCSGTVHKDSVKTLVYAQKVSRNSAQVKSNAVDAELSSVRSGPARTWYTKDSEFPGNSFR